MTLPTEPMSQSVTLLPVDPAIHSALLKRWLRLRHVERWWGDADSCWRHIEATPPDQHALIAVAGTPVGYLRWQPVVADDLEALGLIEIPHDAVDADILIGEAQWLGRGIGPCALRSLLAQLSTGGFSMLGLCTSVENRAAIRAFEKAGFTRLRQYDDPSFGRCWVMAAHLPFTGERAV